ncbi:hypothetical protein [Oceanotoga sp.]|uniref:hypothetical protein n=1 Tax=Oceanotoga sp. TaxID=2108366 RepID=UPI00280647FE|nr:hypothetical protein [Oceanotoga sp.]
MKKLLITIAIILISANLFSSPISLLDDTVKLIFKQFGDDGVKLLSKYGDDAVKIATKYGDDGVKLLSKYGDDAVKITTKYGDDGVKLLSKYGDDAVKITTKYGDDGVKLLSKYGDDASKYITKYGDKIVPSLNKYSKLSDDVIIKYGDDLIKTSNKVTNSSDLIAVSSAIKTHPENTVKIIEITKKYGDDLFQYIKKNPKLFAGLGLAGALYKIATTPELLQAVTIPLEKGFEIIIIKIGTILAFFIGFMLIIKFEIIPKLYNQIKNK